MPPSPEEIQREIEATRAELAATVEQIADRVSPKKVAARSATAAKDKVEGVFAPVPAAAVTPPPVIERMKWERVAAAVAAVALVVTAIVKVKTRDKTPKTKLDKAAQAAKASRAKAIKAADAAANKTIKAAKAAKPKK